MLNFLNGYDFSQYQGEIPLSTFTNLSTNEFAMIRVNFGTPDNSNILNLDSQYIANRTKVRTANSLHGFDHFSYPVLNSALAEADFFIHALGSLQQGEILALDFEQPILVDGTPVQQNVNWVLNFCNEVRRITTVSPLVYINLNLLRLLDWTSVAEANYGLWLAEWTGNPNDIVGLKYWKFITMSQFSDQATVVGIEGRVDNDAFYGTVDEFKKYGFVQPSVTANSPVAVVPPEVPVTGTELSQPTNTPTPTTNPPVVHASTTTINTPIETQPVNEGIFIKIWNWIKFIFIGHK